MTHGITSRKTVLLAMMAVLCTMPAFTQTDVRLDPEFGARISAAVDKKIIKGLHISLEEEARFDNNFRGFQRLQTTLGASYKVNNYFKCGVGYVLIAPYSSSTSSFGNLRHRLYADATGSIKFGNFSIALKERFQWTYRMGDFNEYQNPRNAFTLKSRLTFKYKFRKVTPFAYFEIRNVFNAPVIHANFDGSSYLTDSGSEKGEPGWFLDGFKGVYVNRYRGATGIDVKVDSKNELSFYFMGDYLYDKVVDANAEGTKLKSYTTEKGFFGTIGAEYTFSF